MRRHGAVSPAIGVALGLSLAATGVAWAQEETVVYTGCLDNQGVLSKVAVGEEPLGPCDKSSQLAQWSQEGPAGPRGEQCPQGEQGEQGEKGDPGASTTYRINQSFTGSALVSGVVKCDEGDLVTGGGYRVVSGPPITVTEDYPSGARGWTVSLLVTDGSTTPIEFEVHAVCSDLDPLRGE